MKIKTSELTGAAFDWAVAKCEGLDAETLDPLTWECTAHPSGSYSYSTNWAQGGPIIEREGISVHKEETGEWSAMHRDRLFCEDGSEFFQTGPTPLTATMRCFVASRLGDEVDVPEELT